MKQVEKNPELKWLVPTITFFLIFIMAARTPIDSDMWWQMKSGEVTISQLQPLTWDVFTHSVPGKEWINHAWLGQVLLFLLYQVFSFAGIATMMGIAAASSMILVYYQMESPYFFRAFVLIAFSLVAAPVWTPRPQIISLLFFAILTYLIYLYRHAEKNYLFWLPIIFVIWSNTHGGYTLGFILLGSVFVGELINQLMDPGDEKRVMYMARQGGSRLKSMRLLLIWTLISVLAVMLNANGLRIFTIPFQTISIGVLQDFIPEWASPNFHNLVEQPFIAMLMATISAIGLSGKKMDGVEVISLGLFTAMALLAKRNFGPFVIIAAPILGNYGWLALKRFSPALRNFEKKFLKTNRLNQRISAELPRTLQRSLNFFLVILCICAALIKVNYVTSPEIMDDAVAEIFPTGAVTWLKSVKPEGQLINDYNWGGYLIWHLPEYPVYIDGRTDLFGDDFLQEYLNIYSAESGWQTQLAKYDVRIALLPVNSPLALNMSIDPDWEINFQDAMSIVLTRKSP